MAGGRIYVGIGGWTYAPWRGPFYPAGLPQKDELAYAATNLTAIEINGTFYRSQKPETFAKWRDAVPDGFKFSLKAPRYATNRRVLAEAGESIQRFTDGGVTELGDRLGPLVWQFADTKRFDPDDFGAFLSLLPASAAGEALRHVVEVRHETFCCAEFVELARKHKVAVVWATESKHPEIADRTADFAYVRMMGSDASHKLGYGDGTLDTRATDLRALAAGKPAPGREPIGPAADTVPGDVFAFFIAGHKVANPTAARALIERL